MAGGNKRKAVKNDFVVSDDEDTPPVKKGKAAASTFEPSTAVKTDDDGNKYWELSGLRRVTISDFKKNSMVSIREYYEKDALMELLPQIEKQLKAKGEQVPRPNYTGRATEADDEEDEEQPTNDDEESSESANGKAPSGDNDDDDD